MYLLCVSAACICCVYLLCVSAASIYCVYFVRVSSLYIIFVYQPCLSTWSIFYVLATSDASVQTNFSTVCRLKEQLLFSPLFFSTLFNIIFSTQFVEFLSFFTCWKRLQGAISKDFSLFKEKPQRGLNSNKSGYLLGSREVV